MPYLILFFKGFIIGIGKIMPGVSGSMLAVCMGIYEQALNYLANFRKNIKDSLNFLIPLGLGILLAILLFSKIILFFLNIFPLATMSLFFGLLLGTIPCLKTKIKFKLKDYLFIIIIISILIMTSGLNVQNIKF